MTELDRLDAPDDTSSAAQSLVRLLAAGRGRSDDAVAVVNGLFGDALDERGSRLATAMTFQLGDMVLPTDRDLLPSSLDAAVPRVGSRLCVLVHGLMSNEGIWQFPGGAATTYGSLLEADHDVTALTVRYNTGRHISVNGRELADRLDHIVHAWPVRVREINLIGHSMGGLVVRSACHYGRRIRPIRRRPLFGRRWTSRVRRLVLIGVPNTGAGLEALVNSTSSALWSVPVPATRLVGLGLDRRSAGIRDLRFGAIVDDDWLEHDPGARHRPHPHRPTRLRRADHLVIAGSLTADHEHPVARVLGDALVTSSSAAGRSDDGELFPGATVRMFPKVTHNALAHHPDVYGTIAEWW